MKITFDIKLYLLLGPDEYHSVSLGPLTTRQLLGVLTTWPEPESAYRASYQPEHAWLQDPCISAMRDYNELTQDEDAPTHSFAGWRWLGIAVAGDVQRSGTSLWISQIADPQDRLGNVAQVTVSEHDLDVRVRDAARQAVAILSASLDAPASTT